MTPKKKICKECGREDYIFSKGRCKPCASKSYKKPVQKRKPTGEADMFREIWEERPHVCENCSMHLGSTMIVSYFSHRKPKGKYPELRLDKSNIDLLCVDCHYMWEHDKAEFERRKNNPSI